MAGFCKHDDFYRKQETLLVAKRLPVRERKICFTDMKGRKGISGRRHEKKLFFNVGMTAKINTQNSKFPPIISTVNTSAEIKNHYKIFVRIGTY